MAWFEDFAATSARAAEDAAAGVTDALLDVAEDLKGGGLRLRRRDEGHETRDTRRGTRDEGHETRDTWTDGVDEVRLGVIGGGHLGGCLAFLGVGWALEAVQGWRADADRLRRGRAEQAIRSDPLRIFRRPERAYRPHVRRR